jgi:putative ABC transport system permease protein
MALSDLQDLTGKEKIVSMFMIQPLSPSFAQSIERSINDDFDEIHAASDKSIMNSVNDMLDQLNMTTFALGSIAAIISGIVIMNVMIISVRERKREIGIMKAVGATNSQILLTILLESVSISVIGAIIGIFLSFGGVVFINTILFSPIAIITPRLIIQGILFAASIGAISGILPARQAAGLNPIEALVYE